MSRKIAEEAAAEGPLESARGRRAVWVEKLLSRILQKHGVVEGWMPEPGDFDAMGSFRDRDSTKSRTKGHGSMS